MTTNQANPDGEAYHPFRANRASLCRKGPAHTAVRASLFVAADRVELRTEGAPTAGNLSEKAMRGNLTGDEPGFRPEHKALIGVCSDPGSCLARPFLVGRTCTHCTGEHICRASPVWPRTQALGVASATMLGYLTLSKAVQGIRIAAADQRAAPLGWEFFIPATLAGEKVLVGKSRARPLAAVEVSPWMIVAALETMQGPIRYGGRRASTWRLLATRFQWSHGPETVSKAIHPRHTHRMAVPCPQAIGLRAKPARSTHSVVPPSRMMRLCGNYNLCTECLPEVFQWLTLCELYVRKGTCGDHLRLRSGEHGRTVT